MRHLQEQQLRVAHVQGRIAQALNRPTATVDGDLTRLRSELELARDRITTRSDHAGSGGGGGVFGEVMTVTAVRPSLAQGPACDQDTNSLDGIRRHLYVRPNRWSKGPGTCAQEREEG